MNAIRMSTFAATLLVTAACAQDRLTMGPPIGASWGATYGLPPAKATAFVDDARRLGAAFTRVTLYWAQLEPKPDVPRWKELDAFVAQLHAPDEAVLTLASASPWGTRTATWVFPSSPAKDPDAYYRFVRDTVRHAAGRIRYFQNDPEPNNPFFWAGSVNEFIAQQKLFYRAVKDADPQAIVVLGGCDGLFDPTGREPLPRQAETVAFFSRVIAEASGDFDVFDLRLYADPYTIPARVAFVRGLLDRAGGRQPIVATEYAGPTFFEFRANRRHAAALGGAASADAVRALMHATDLPLETRMFLPGAGPADAATLLRLQTRDLVVRNVIALAAGVQRTAFWDLSHDTHDPASANTMMYGTLRLFDVSNDDAVTPTALGRAFARMAGRLGDASRVERIATIDDTVFAFRIERAKRPSGIVVWRRPDGPAADATPQVVELPWTAGPGHATTLDDQETDLAARSGVVGVMVGADPVFVEAVPASSLR